MTDPATLALELRREYAELETVDIAGVEVLSTGGPVHGQGSPPEGDYWTREQLEAIAAANRELAAQVKPPNKIGHSDAQTLVANSALPAATPGEMPAVGWLDGSTFRVVDDGDGAKLVADAKAVPKKFAQLIDVGAYRTRSVELSKITDQATQKVYDWVVTGLAWLGAKLPAVQTLDDVVALYARAEIDVDEHVRQYVIYAVAEGTVVWEPGSSFQALRDDVSAALNGQPTGGMNEPRFWVSDINVAGDRALVQDYYGEGNAGFVIPFTRAADGTITIAPSSDWQAVEEGWVAAATEYARKNARAAESSPVPELTLTDEQVAKLREQLGVEGDEVTVDQLVEAAETRANELADTKTKLDEAETRQNEAGDAAAKVRDLEARVEASERRAFEMERDQTLGAAVKDGRVDPGDLEKWQKRYDANADLTKEILSELRPDLDLVRELGREDGDVDGSGDAAYRDEASSRLGIASEALL